MEMGRGGGGEGGVEGGGMASLFHLNIKMVILFIDTRIEFARARACVYLRWQFIPFLFKLI